MADIAHGPLGPLERNRFFYGKLMDVRQWEMEQSYGIDARRLLTRLGDGSGVLCGLGLTVNANGALLVDPGVAIDPHGREIVVPERVCFPHPEQPTDCVGATEGEPVIDGKVTVCLHYHECLAEPVPALAVDCETRDRCETSVVRERYCICIERGVPEAGPGLGEACGAIFPDRPPDGFDRRAVAYGALSGTCLAPGDSCVVLGTITFADGHLAAFTDGQPGPVDAVTHRALVPSNRTLFELILCLARRVDECCGRDHPTRGVPPRVVAMRPAPGEITDSDALERGGLRVTFDREMDATDLQAPDAWLRLWTVVVTQVLTHVVPPQWMRVQLSYAGRVSSVPGAVVEKFTVTMPDLGDHQVATRYLAQIRADATTAEIKDTSNPPLVLDPDYAGTGLDDTMLDAIWTNDDPNDAAALARMPLTTQPPMGVTDGMEGGRFHCWFAERPRQGDPPRLETVWPVGGVELAPVDTERKIWLASFLDAPRLELTIDRDLLDTAVQAPKEWVRVWQLRETMLAEVALQFAGTTTPTLPEATGVTYAYKIDAALGPLRELPSTFVAVIWGDPRGIVVGDAAPTLLLDSNVDLTSLTVDQLDKLWNTGTLDVAGIGLAPSGTTRNEQLWDGAPGGRAHYMFTIDPN